MKYQESSNRALEEFKEEIFAIQIRELERESVLYQYQWRDIFKNFHFGMS